MRFLADECCDFAVVRVLRAAGHDVVAVAEVAPRAEDEIVIGIAAVEGRILITEDKDFGQLVYSAGHSTGGVILLRFPALARARQGEAVLQLVTERGDQLLGRFVVAQPGRFRISSKPES